MSPKIRSFDPFDVISTRALASQRATAQLRVLAPRSQDIVLCGEPGVGKSLVARVVHLASPRRDGPWAVFERDALHSSADPWSAFERRPGTIVLEEPGVWSARRQADAWEALQTMSPAGVVEPPARVIVTSRLSPAQLVDEGRLLPELAQRWAPAVVTLPPLRERLDDLVPLVEDMLMRAGKSALSVDAETWSALTAYRWPDNVRELREVIDHALARVGGIRLEPHHLELDPLVPPSLLALADRPFEEVRRELDTWYLRRMLHQTEGNISEAARRSGCSRKVFRDRLRRRGLYPVLEQLRAGSRAKEPRAWSPPELLVCREPQPVRPYLQGCHLIVAA